jgi:hypothetical protein
LKDPSRPHPIGGSGRRVHAGLLEQAHHVCSDQDVEGPVGHHRAQVRGTLPVQRHHSRRLGQLGQVALDVAAHERQHLLHVGDHRGACERGGKRQSQQPAACDDEKRLRLSGRRE